MPHAIAKRCPLCATAFSLRALVESPEVQPMGLTMIDEDPEVSVFYFNHLPSKCMTTFALPISAFTSLIRERVPTKCHAYTEVCEGHCQDRDDHALCSQDCRNAPYRRFMVDVLMPRGKGRAP